MATRLVGCMERASTPWALETATIKDGMHAVDCVNSYRLGMVWLFERARSDVPGSPDRSADTAR